MRLFIAEKPSLGRAIAEQLGVRQKNNTHIECANGCTVTWCFGHLLEQAPPESYKAEWKQWSESTLPITIPENGWKLKPRNDALGQIKAIQHLLRDAREVVNAGDPGREGQLLVDEVLEYLSWRGKTLRLLLNATDPANVKKALSSMRDNTEFIPILDAAKCRSRADWLVGMNLSRAATLMLSEGSAISIGRVQTPTLGLVVRRDLEIEGFVTKPFYSLTANVTCQDKNGQQVQLSLKHDSPDVNLRILEEALAKAIAKQLTGSAQRLSVQTSSVSNMAPLPHDLADFQKEAEAVYGWGAAKSLGVLQELYEAKLTTYPRTECRYLPAEQASDALRILRTAIKHLSPVLTAAQEQYILGMANTGAIQPSARIYDAAKMEKEEHHGIIPTGVAPSSVLSKDMVAGYALVCRRFVQSLMPDHVFDQTVISFEALTPGSGDIETGPKTVKRTFHIKGALEGNKKQSWKILAIPPKTPRPGDEVIVLPPIGNGAMANVGGVSISRGKTSPPKHYTEATLIADMRQAAKFVTDPRMKSILKETTGIGTAATQANILETLKDKGFLEVVRKSLISTPLGRQVISVCPAALHDIGMTAAWEEALSLIAKSRYKPSEFMRRIDGMVINRIDDMRRLRDEGKRITERSKIEMARRSAEAKKRTPSTRGHQR